MFSLQKRGKKIAQPPASFQCYNIRCNQVRTMQRTEQTGKILSSGLRLSVNLLINVEQHQEFAHVICLGFFSPDTG